MDIVYIGRTNTIQKAILNSLGKYVDAPENLEGSNKVRLLLVDKDGVQTAFDSAANAAYFSTAARVDIGGAQVRPVTLKLGNAGLAKGEYEATMSIFTELYPLGLTVGDFRISVRNS